METLSYGDLTICEMALILFMKGVSEDSELGKQILECIAKIDLLILSIRAETDKKD